MERKPALNSLARLAVVTSLMFGSSVGCARPVSNEENKGDAKATRSAFETELPTPRPLLTPTPDILETQRFLDQWQRLENAEQGDEFEITKPKVSRIMQFPWQGGDAYWTELNNEVTALQ